MKPNPIPMIAIALMCCFYAAAQPVTTGDSRHRISLRSGSFIPEKNITPEKITEFSNHAARSGNRGFALLQFEQLPGLEQRKQLQARGIELLEYIPQNAYTISYSGSLNVELLQQVHARAVVELKADQKMQPELARGNFPAWAVKIAGTVDIWISFPKTFTQEYVLGELRNKNVDILPCLYKNYRIIAARISSSRINELADLPFVEYVQFAPHADVELNNISIANGRANVLHSSLPGGHNLQGDGVVIGIGDNADPFQHVDFTDRIINRMSLAGGAHGVHVIGTAIGAGNITERFRGYAPKASVLAQTLSNILAYAPSYVQDHGMVISNNSYGNVVNDCKNFGYYELYSRVLDQQATDMPNLSIVFAAGNSGTRDCGKYALGFGTVLSGYQAAKNVITVGATAEIDTLALFSSKGPVQDGRIKPEITAQGKNVISSWSINSYSFSSGTSMATPAVSGGLALLYQRYRQIHGALTNPKNGLMKALLCNGATDLGNPGPDYKYGFGWMNLWRSVQMLDNNAWFNTTVAPGATNTHDIVIPATPSIAQLKVMLYWNDSAASVLSAQTLVNDLDLEVEDPALSIILPQKLDTIPANINNAATTGVDHINNIEQVLINNPVPGATYKVKVKGTTIPSGLAQDYVVTYDIVPISTTLTYPIGSERLKPGDSVYISWDSWGAPSNTFTVEFFDGATWSTIPNGTVAANLREVKWFVPNVVTDAGRIRVTRNGTGMVSTSEVFTIIGYPSVTFPFTQCEGYLTVDWTSVPGATDYEVMMVRGGEMVSITTSPGNTYTIGGLSPDTLYFVSVRARINGNPGQRGTAVSRYAASIGTCPAAASDNDIKLDSILTPAVSGRKFTSTEFSAAVPLTVRIKNLDDVASTSALTFSYTINGVPVIDPPVSPTINAFTTFDYTFAAPLDLSVIGTYVIVVTVTKTGDPIITNNVLTRTIRQLDNQPIPLVTTWLDNLETAATQEHTSRLVGLTGLDRYDFVNSTVYGRVRSFINTGIAYSGTKALTLDASTVVTSGNTDSLTGTFNLGAFNITTDDIRFDFRYKNHVQEANPANNVWIRGDDQKPWVKVYDLFANQPEPDGSYKLITGIELSDSLSTYLQNYSSSFQVRWGQWGKYLAADNDGGAGYTIDDIRLYRVTDDLKIMSIDTPIVSSCGLSATTPVRITVRNTSNTITANPVPVQFRVDGGSWVIENIPPIAANTSVTYTFTATANLLTTGSHLVEARVAYPTDSYFDNDTLSVQLVNSPVITVTTTTPYLQDFEAGNGSWYASGKNISWEYGTPTSTKINRAASGAKAWKTRSKGNYNDKEVSYLYSPCFDITGLANPTLSMSLSLDLEDCGINVLCDGAWVEYSADGITWDTLGAFGQGTNWYNRNLTTGIELWSIQDYTRWHVATIPLPLNIANLRLRVVMFSDVSLSKEGIAVDDIHIYDNPYGIYTATGTSPVVNQAVVNGTGWIDFVETGTQRLIASIKPDGQDLGSTDVQSYVHTGAVRFEIGGTTNQYYHNRNITIKPATVNLPDSATVRFYFTDTETEALINATGCGVCYKPSTAYDLGVTKYSDPDDNFENGTLSDNIQGTHLFINSLKVRKVPFDRGYYAQFRVKDFSEFWLNNGGFNNNTALPVELISFTAKKKGTKDVIVEWTTTSEQNVDRYEIEVARGITAFQQTRFERIGIVRSRGNSNQQQQYELIDLENNKTGVRYYRMKIIEADGRFSYTVVRPVQFNDEVTWQVYPNPSKGMYNLVYQLPEGEQLTIKVYDVNGKTIEQIKSASNGFMQKLNIDIQRQQFPPGLYLLEAIAGERKHIFKLVKQ